VSKQALASLPTLCVFFHQSVFDLSATFLAKERRHYYVTPTSYLELLLSYKEMLLERQTDVSTVKTRYIVGLEKLGATEDSVALMQEQLIALQPQLEAAKVETDAAMAAIAAETVEADAVKKVVSQEEAVASQEAAVVKAIKDDCEADLAKAMPMLDAALKALNTLTKNDITEVKGMKSPPAGAQGVARAACPRCLWRFCSRAAAPCSAARLSHATDECSAAGVKLVLEAVCILKGIKPTRVKDPNSGKMVEDYWESSKRLLMEPDFLQSLHDFDKDNISPKVIEQIKKYIVNPDFEPEKVLQVRCVGG